MAIGSSRRRTTLRVASALAAAAAGSIAVAATVARRRAAAPPPLAHPAPKLTALRPPPTATAEALPEPPMPRAATLTVVAPTPVEPPLPVEPPRVDPALLVEAPPAGSAALVSPTVAPPAFEPPVEPPPVVPPYMTPPVVRPPVEAPLVAPLAVEPPTFAPPIVEPPIAEPSAFSPPIVEPPPVKPLVAPPAEPDGGRRKWLLVVGVAAVVVVVAAGFAMTRGDDEPTAVMADESDAGTGTTEAPSTTVVEDLTPDAAFAQAAARLEEAGTFAYSGSSLATDVSPVRPGLWLKVELAMGGEVDLRSYRLHEVAEATDGQVTETVTDGIVVWGRLADSRESLPDETYLTVGDPAEPPLRLGAGLLPTWLNASIDRQELPDDGTPTSGRRFRATIPADVFGPVEDGRPAVDAELLLTLDPSGDPQRIEITNAPDGPPLRLVLDLTRLGEPVDIALPEDPSTTTSP